MSQAKTRNFIDWTKLEHEFLTNEKYSKVSTWLREEKKWTDKQIVAGNTTERTVGWGKMRAEYRQELVEQRREVANQAMLDLIPSIVDAKRAIIEYYLDALINGIDAKVKQPDGTYKDVKRPLGLKDRSHILTKLKTELGEPAIITKQNTEDVGEHKDPALMVLIAMGIINGTDDDKRLKVQVTADNAQAPIDVA